MQKLLEVIIRVLHCKSHWTTPCSSKIKCNYVHPLSKCLERKKNEVRQVNQNPFKNIDKYTLLSSSFLPVGLTGRGKFSFSLLLFFSLFLCVWVFISFRKPDSKIKQRMLSVWILKSNWFISFSSHRIITTGRDCIR